MKHRREQAHKKKLAYGEYRFCDRIMRERLPASVYEEIKKVQAGKKELTLEIAETVAGAMKDWAIEYGATHYTHWFQPLTGRTAEKHDSFIRPLGDGSVLMEFSGKELIKGESDASSFPSGGLRATFEARGYTAWDTTSPAFLKEDPQGVTLYIPTAFISYNGEALDKKVPLLRSINALAKQTQRILKLFGINSEARVLPTVGPEQEYFLIEKTLYAQRPDLRFCGRTILGCSAPKGQELEDHYYGQIPERVAIFMRDLNQELWRLGVSAKTQHKEVAPNQFEIATVYGPANVAADDNQLVMETIQKVAQHHGLVALLHEKPFAGVNGSGKHINWSISYDNKNLLEPGNEPATNLLFLITLTAILTAVDRHASLLRATVASAGNDLRLGANEAPPAIVSIFLGDELTAIMDHLGSGNKKLPNCSDALTMDATQLPKLPRDISDRNRTSPFAFTGNKFEFRMAPSSESISTAVAVLNAAVASVFEEFADRLEQVPCLEDAVYSLVAEYWKKYNRVVFNGNGYSKEWVEEAKRRGLPNLSDSVSAFSAWSDPVNVAMLKKQGIFSQEELHAIQHVEYETYTKRILIEAKTMQDMIERHILPAVREYLVELIEWNMMTGDTGLNELELIGQERVKTFAEQSALLENEFSKFKQQVASISHSCKPYEEQAVDAREILVPAMVRVRAASDVLESMMPADRWPFPGYTKLLFEI